MEPVAMKALFAHGGIAIFGALAHALQKQRNGQSKGFFDFVALALMSSFSGVVFALIGLHFFGGQHYLTLAMAGTGGFLGVEGLAIVVERIQQLISLNNKK